MAVADVASLLARQMSSTGGSRAEDGEALARQVIEQLTRRSAEFMLRVALGSDGVDHGEAEGLLGASLARHQGAATVKIALSSPLTAIGASAATYYAKVAELAGTRRNRAGTRRRRKCRRRGCGSSQGPAKRHHYPTNARPIPSAS